MGEPHRETLRRSERIAKRPHHLRDFYLEDSDEPARKSPRDDNNLHQTTLQNESEGMALENIEKLIGELSNCQRTTIDEIKSLNGKFDDKFRAIEEKVSELSSLVTNTRSDLTTRLDKLSRQSKAQENNSEAQSSNNDSASGNSNHGGTPLTRSTSNVSINSIESVEQITRQISASITTALGSHRKLIALPKFNGEPDKWPQFIAQFDRTTSREHYSTEDNVTRLEQALEGKAKALVSSLLIHHVNVPRIIERLRSRFGMPEQLVDTQLAVIRRYEPIQDDQLSKIVPFSDAVMNLRNFLESANCSEHLSSPSLLKELESKLPYRERITWGGYSMSLRPPTVREFSDWLTILADQIHRVCSKESDDKKKKARVFHASEGNSGSCLMDLCDKSHPLNSCELFINESYDNKWDIVKDNNLCFSCLRAGHRVYWCGKARPCGIDGCNANHHKLLHNGPSKQLNSEAEVFQPATILNCQVRSVKVLFKILPVKVSGPGGQIETFAFLDEGSSVTLMNQDIADRIGATGQKGNLELRWFGNIGSNEETTVTNIAIAGAFQNAKEFKMSGVHVVKDLKLPKQTLEIDQLHHKFHSMKRLPIQQFKDVTPTILIGLDNAYLGVARNQQRSATNGPIVCLTKLGYVVYGPTDLPLQGNEDGKPLFLAASVQENLHETVQKYFSTEEFGVQPSRILEPKEHQRANTILQETTRKVDGRFESGLLWRDDHPSLPNNLKMAIKRFESCEKKMSKDTVYGAAYRKTMSEYFEKGYAKELSDTEFSSPKGPVWYLPHFGILNPNKPKFRLVFDAAATFCGTSLNSKLLSGPDLNQPLIQVLATFREKKYAVCADIREMFHQITIRDEDKDAQRFVYRNHPKEPLKIYRMEVMTFGSTSSPTTAQYVKNLNARCFEKSMKPAVEAILKKHYVDDYVDSFDSIEEAICVSTDVKTIHKSAGFELRGFLSNCYDISRALNDEECRPETKTMEGEGPLTGDRILGLSWSIAEDCFIFELKFHKIDPDIVENARYPTKREFLSILMSVFDPFGFIADFMVHLKILLQQIWRLGIDWDDVIPESYHSTWSYWMKEVKKVHQLKIPRCLISGLHEGKTIEMHTLVDASECAFSAVCYLRVVMEDETIAVAFIAGKTRNAPLKHLSIPRLELQAALLGARLSSTFRELHTFRIDQNFYWSDSKTVLFWLKDEKRRYRQFVSNRVSEILDSSTSQEWRWVPSQDNVADDATRYNHSPTFNASSRWIKGPDWLWKGTWPQQPTDLQTSEISEEVLPDKKSNAVLLHVNTPIIAITNYSDWYKLKRHVAWILRFIRFLREKKAVRSGALLASELRASEMALYRLAQREELHSEYESLKAGKSVSKRSSIYRLSPYIDEEDVIRVSGRIDNAPTIPLFTKRPIILPKGHHLTYLIVQSYHEFCAHQFDELIVAEVRRKYWISGIKSLVKRVKRSCVPCKMFYAKPEQPMMGQIPKERLTPFVRPFSHMGVDYFGPIDISIGRRHEKRWVALFTCLTVRAVHLEISQDLSSDAFILCLKNVMNIRGVPSVIYSDNGSNFVGAKNEIIKCSEFFDQCPVQNEASKRGITWKFNHPGDPAAGGCWERLVQSIKRVLKRIMKDASPKLETLRSFLIEASNIVNSRPLTEVSVSSINDDPLTPNSFLIGCPNSIQTPGPIDEKLWCLRKQYRILNSLKNHFWQKWITEYLPELTRRSKWFEPVAPLKVGDVVIICEENLATRDWSRGIVVEVFRAKDDQVRGALVKVGGKIVKRPASKLAKLDIGNPLTDKELRGEGCRLEYLQHSESG